MIRLQELRKSRGLNQKQLGDILGAAQNSISNWERGTREMDNETLQKAADYFGVTTDYLLGRTDYPYEPNTVYLEAERSTPSITREDMQRAADEHGVTLTRRDERSIMQQIEALHEDLANPDVLMLSGGEDLDENTITLLKAALESAIVKSKVRAKAKYTPKKYRRVKKG